MAKLFNNAGDKPILPSITTPPIATAKPAISPVGYGLLSEGAPRANALRCKDLLFDRRSLVTVLDMQTACRCNELGHSHLGKRHTWG